jgi:hypothetical protein
MAAPRPKSPHKEPAAGRKLTPQQALFADHVISGTRKTDAYRHAYPASSLTGHALNVEASRTAALPHVADYIAEALAERRREVLLTRDDKRQILGSIAKDTRKPASARILAVKTDNEMTGDNAPVRVEGEITLGLIFRALVGTTGLPAPAEMKHVLPADPADAMPVMTLADDDSLPLPALERKNA